MNKQNIWDRLANGAMCGIVYACGAMAPPPENLPFLIFLVSLGFFMMFFIASLMTQNKQAYEQGKKDAVSAERGKQL